MTTVFQELIEANNFEITGGSEYQWQCFGFNARYLDFDQEDRFSINCVFDTADHTVYIIEAWDYVNHREYRWINPGYIEAYKEACKENEVDFRESFDNNKFIDLEVVEDMFEKIQGIRNEEEYDTRVRVPIDFSDSELLELMKLAHEKDITFNQLVEEALSVAIEDAKKGGKFE